MTTIADLKRTNQRRFSAAPERVIDPDKKYTATLKTDHGDIVIDLAAKEAPNTVNNFVYLSSVGYYDGLNFHRVITSPPFMIQGGCPLGTGTGGPGYQFADEFSPNLRHSGPGMLSMANAGPGTNGSQFFITLAAQPHLDNHHTVFGHVTTGMDAVQKVRQGDKINRIDIEES
ncbi:MAG TPA: peptidylprolyl isomerase [Dehalococcoidia bacterium]|nr:peptidylprolyl isomerase [Dehalococcoidia bacterium]